MTKITFEQAKAAYVHRFTMEHVPRWASSPTSDGKFYAPRYRTDREWYDNTKFPSHNFARYCDSINESWPLGRWLDKPYTGEK